MKLSKFNLIAEELGVRAQYRGAVVTVHGMKTRGAWQKKISTVLQDAALRHEPLDYGSLIIGSFFPRSRDAVANQLVSAVTKQQKVVPHGPHGIIAHSFGTLCLGRALKSNPSLRLGRICLFGGILHRNFPWKKIRERGQFDAVLNESCSQDPWPRCASLLLFWTGAGASGRYGFLEQACSVYECPYDWTGHSQLGTVVHCQNTWLPFLLRGKLPPGVIGQ